MSKFSGYQIDVVVWEAHLAEIRKKNLLQTANKIPTLEEISIDVCLSLNMNVGVLKINRGKKEDVYCRFIFYVAAQQFGNFSFVKIGSFCKKNHTTILHGVRTAQNLIDTKSEAFLSMWCAYLKNSKMYNKQP